jgi:chemotaxis signal transduction protein
VPVQGRGTVRVNARVVALAFDDVLGIYSFSPSQTMELPPLLKEVAGETVSQVTTRDAELLLFFESARLFPTDLLETLVEKQMTG